MLNMSSVEIPQVVDVSFRRHFHASDPDKSNEPARCTRPRSPRTGPFRKAFASRRQPCLFKRYESWSRVCNGQGCRRRIACPLGRTAGLAYFVLAFFVTWTLEACLLPADS